MRFGLEGNEWWNCRRLTKHYDKVIDGIRLILIEISKGIISDDAINLITNTHKELLKEMNDTYRCIRSLSINDKVIYYT